MCQHLKKSRHLGRCRHMPARLGADTCRHVPTSLILIIWTFLFGCWYVLTCVSTWKGANTWESADTSRCRHVSTRADIPDINHMDFFICKLGCAGMCQHLKKVPTPGKVPTRAGTSSCRDVPTRADIPDTNHMDFFICKLGCAAMCQRLKKCRHLGRCRHVPARLGADTCRHPSY